MTKPEILSRGDLFRHIKAGGGGCGNPLEREPEAVLADVTVEKLTPGHAAEAYGVVVSGEVESGFTIDREATDGRRRAMAMEASR